MEDDVFQKVAEPRLFHLLVERVKLLCFNCFAVYVQSVQFQAQRVLHYDGAVSAGRRAVVSLLDSVVLRGVQPLRLGRL